jgi:hypothetical protein
MFSSVGVQYIFILAFLFWQGQFRRVLFFFHRNDRVDVAHTRKGRQVIQIKRLVRLEITNDNFQQEIAFAQEQVTLEHFGPGLHLAGKIVVGAFGLPVQSDRDKNRQSQSQRFRLEQGRVPGDHTRILEPFDAAQAGRGCQANLIGQVGVGNPGVALECLKNLFVYCIEFKRHKRTITRVSTNTLLRESRFGRSETQSSSGQNLLRFAYQCLTPRPSL